MTEFADLAGQQIKPSARKAMMTPEEVAEVAYPTILKGKRVIVPGCINKIAVLIGKLLPFPAAFWVMRLVYRHSMDKIVPKYPLQASTENDPLSDEKNNRDG